MKYDLKNITHMLNKLHNPHNNFQSIHIGGTNGKGATASFIASILMEHGLKAGLFTSPHIIRFNERIRINGKCISDKYVKEFLDNYRSLIKKVKPSFFEVNTAMAFKYFAERKVDVAVVECGLGGRLDSTNVLKPELCIITQIGMDHMQYLGRTLKKIALEKIGIAKPDVDVIVSDNNKSLKKIFKDKIKPDSLIYIDDKFTIKNIKGNLSGSKFNLSNNKSKKVLYNIPLPGVFQTRNAATAIISCKEYLYDNGITPSENKIRQGLSKVKTNSGYRCRLEMVKLRNKEFIFDISHNADGIKETAQAFRSGPPDVVIFGMMDDKDLYAAIHDVLNISNTIILTKANYKRAAEPETLFRIASKYHAKRHFITIQPSVSKAIKFVSQQNNFKKILVTGSFFIVGEAIKELRVRSLFK